MSTKTFIVEIASGPETLWQRPDGIVSEMLYHTALSVATIATEGRHPEVKVTQVLPPRLAPAAIVQSAPQFPAE